LEKIVVPRVQQLFSQETLRYFRDCWEQGQTPDLKYLVKNKLYRKQTPFLITQPEVYDSEDEDANIKEWNQKIELFHGVLASAAKQEHEGRVKPDVFSEEERKAIIQLKLKSRFKQLQTTYLKKIAGLMVEGLTEEQAREKIYRDLLTTDPRAANLMREFQDKVHPLVKKDQKPPQSPLQPQSPL
jgi:hypothetical protein